MNSFVIDSMNVCLEGKWTLITNVKGSFSIGASGIDFRVEKSTNPFIDAIEKPFKEFHRYTIQECKDILKNNPSLANQSVDDIRSLLHPDLNLVYHHALFNKNIISVGKPSRKLYNAASQIYEEPKHEFYRYTIQECKDIKQKNPIKPLDHIFSLLNPDLNDNIYYILFDKNIAVNEKGDYAYRMNGHSNEPSISVN